MQNSAASNRLQWSDVNCELLGDSNGTLKKVNIKHYRMLRDRIKEVETCVSSCKWTFWHMIWGLPLQFCIFFTYIDNSAQAFLSVLLVCNAQPSEVQLHSCHCCNYKLLCCDGIFMVTIKFTDLLLSIWLIVNGQLVWIQFLNWHYLLLVYYNTVNVFEHLCMGSVKYIKYCVILLNLCFSSLLEISGTFVVFYWGLEISWYGSVCWGTWDSSKRTM